jgi:hypothetical protein
LSPRFPQPIFRPKHFSSATFQHSSTWQTEAITASLNYSIWRGVLDNQEFGNLMHARHNVINTNLKYSKHFKPLTGSSFGRKVKIPTVKVKQNVEFWWLEMANIHYSKCSRDI